MTEITITIDDAKAQALLADLQRRLGNLSPAMAQIGEALAEGSKQRIEAGRDWRGHRPLLRRFRLLQCDGATVDAGPDLCARGVCRAHAGAGGDGNRPARFRDGRKELGTVDQVGQRRLNCAAATISMNGMNSHHHTPAVRPRNTLSMMPTRER